VIGTLNVFMSVPTVFSEEDAALPGACDVATIADLAESGGQTNRDGDVQLQQALDSRIAIEQAKGILSERLNLDMADAVHSIAGVRKRDRPSPQPDRQRDCRGYCIPDDERQSRRHATTTVMTVMSPDSSRTPSTPREPVVVTHYPRTGLLTIPGRVDQTGVSAFLGVATRDPGALPIAARRASRKLMSRWTHHKSDSLPDYLSSATSNPVHFDPSLRTAHELVDHSYPRWTGTTTSPNRRPAERSPFRLPGFEGELS